MREEPSQERRPWWMHVLLSPWYVVKFFLGVLEFGEATYYLLSFVVGFILLSLVGIYFVWTLIF